MRTTSSAVYLTPPAPGQPDAWTTETKGRGSQRVFDAGRTTAPPEVAEALRLTPDATVIYRARLMLVDGEPVEVVLSYYPNDLNGAGDLADPRPVKGGAVRLLADAGWSAATVVEDVSVDTAVADLGYEVPQGTPLLITHRTVYTAADVPYEHTVMAAWDGRRQRYVMELS